MQHRFIPCSVDQQLLLGSDLREWLPEDHLARFIEETVREIDLSVLLAAYDRKDGRGRAGYHPEMLFRLLVYSYCVGVLSSRRIEAAVVTDVAFRFLASNQQPDHTTIAEFRKRHVKEFGDLFLVVLRLCREAGLVKVGTIALDGTKMKANASKRQSRSYQDLKESEEELAAIVKRLQEQSSEIDQREDEQNKPPADRMPEGLKKAQERLEAIRQAKKQLEEEAKQREEAAKQDIEQAKAEGRCPTPAEKKRKQRAKEVVADPDKGRQINLVDPDSRLMKDATTGGIEQGYNAQIIVDTETQVILASDVTSDATDRNQLLPMANSLSENLEHLQPKDFEEEAKTAVAGIVAEGESATKCVLLADTGYWNEEKLKAEAVSGYRLIVPPDRFSHYLEKNQSKPLPANAPKSEFAEATRALMRTTDGKALYMKRQSSVEPVFGQVKQGRGIRGFLLRGMQKVKGEWNLICLAHNVLKLFRQGLAQAEA
jgi:transposase